MMLLHSTASSSTSGAHPHQPQRLPNLKLMVKTPPTNLLDSMLPWMVRTPHLFLRDSMLLWTVTVDFAGNIVW